MNQETKGEKPDALSCDDPIERNVSLGYKNVLFFENRNTACKWLSTVDAAEYLCVTENALRIMVHRGQVQAYKFGRRLRFKLIDCQALIQKKGAA